MPKLAEVPDKRRVGEHGNGASFTVQAPWPENLTSQSAREIFALSSIFRLSKRGRKEGNKFINTGVATEPINFPICVFFYQIAWFSYITKQEIYADSVHAYGSVIQLRRKKPRPLGPGASRQDC